MSSIVLWELTYDFDIVMAHKAEMRLETRSTIFPSKLLPSKLHRTRARQRENPYRYICYFITLSSIAFSPYCVVGRRTDLCSDHCLEYFREAAMCRGDPSITTFGWRDGKPTAHVDSDHECVNWARLSSWAESRSIDMYDASILEKEGL